MNVRPAIQTGARVRLTYGKQQADGFVMLASSNGHSLMLSFDGMLGGFAGMMPVLWDDNSKSYVDLVGQIPVEVTEL